MRAEQLIDRYLEDKNLLKRYADLKQDVEKAATGANIHKAINLLTAVSGFAQIGNTAMFNKYARELIELVWGRGQRYEDVLDHYGIIV